MPTWEFYFWLEMKGSEPYWVNPSNTGMSTGLLHGIWGKKKIVISTSHLLSEFQVSKRMDS